METRTKIVLGLIILVTAVALKFILQPSPQSPQTPQTPQLETKENVGGEVTVSVTPLVLKSGFPASFDIAFETHSVDLLFDVEEIATLSDGTTTSYVPHWEGSPPGGHHRSGTLRFTPDVKNPKTITVILKNVAGVSERMFTWEASK